MDEDREPEEVIRDLFERYLRSHTFEQACALCVDLEEILDRRNRKESHA